MIRSNLTTLQFIYTLCLSYHPVILNTLLKKAQSLNIKVDKDYEIVHEKMT